MITTEDCEEPTIGDAYCVLATYTEKITKWDSFWSTDNTKNQGFVKQARPTGNQFDIMAIGAYTNFDFKALGKNIMKTNPLDIYAIKRSEGFFWTEKPVISTKISEITYDLENMEKSADPVEMNTAVLENYSHIPQTVTRTISYTEEKTFSFDMGGSVESGLTVEVELGFSIPTPVPGVQVKTDIGVEVSVVSTEGFTSGKSETESTTKSITAAMEIPDSNKMTVAIVANKYKTNVPYTATLEKRFYDGTKSKQKISGMFKGVSIDEVKVQYGVIEPLQSISNNLLRRRRRSAEPCEDPDLGTSKICGENARCGKTSSGFDCVCEDGFVGDGEVSKFMFIF